MQVELPESGSQYSRNWSVNANESQLRAGMPNIEKAIERYQSGDISTALMVCKELMQANPDDADAIHLAGLCQWQLREHYLAVELLRRALRLKEDDPKLQYNLGTMELELGEFRNATEQFMRALSLSPTVAEYHYKFGVACERIDQPVEAERAYMRALRLDARYAPAHAELAALLERGNRIQEAQQSSENALRIDPDNETALIIQAQLTLRQGVLEKAESMFRMLLSRQLGPNNRAIVQKRLASCLDKLGKYPEAYQLMAASNSLTEQNGEVQGPGWCTMDAIARIKARSMGLMDAVDRSAHDAKSAGERIVFLIGFPRSGTTLLDRMLDAHENLRVIEERTTLRAMLSDAFAGPDGIADLVRADRSRLDAYREAYWTEVERWIPNIKGGDVIIDKLPLNTMYIPLIHRLFPAARFIFALRDPRDSVFSCFMSSFGMNESMRHFVSLGTAAEYYAAVMGVAVESIPRLGDLVHVQRYEDLILQPEVELKELCAFLGVGWHNTMLEVHKHTQGKRINTPSYHQVTQPLYRSAVGRWRNYREQMAEILPVLEPFVRRWGYEPD